MAEPVLDPDSFRSGCSIEELEKDANEIETGLDTMAAIFMALKDKPESIDNPVRFFQNNGNELLNLIHIIEARTDIKTVDPDLLNKLSTIVQVFISRAKHTQNTNNDVSLLKSIYKNLKEIRDQLTGHYTRLVKEKKETSRAYLIEREATYVEDIIQNVITDFEEKTQEKDFVSSSDKTFFHTSSSKLMQANEILDRGNNDCLHEETVKMALHKIAIILKEVGEDEINLTNPAEFFLRYSKELTELLQKIKARYNTGIYKACAVKKESEE